MKIDEIKKEIQSLNTAVAELREQFTQTYGDEIPQEPAQLSEGLRFKTDTDHFTEAERAVNERLADTIVSSMRTERTLSNELSRITRAQQSREQYTDTLDQDTDLVTLYKQTDETLQQAESITKTLRRLSRALQNIACNRYFNSLTHRGKSRPKDRYNAILSEIDAIGNGADVLTTDGETIRTGGFVIFNERGRSSAEDNAYIEKLYQFFDAIQAVNLICYYSTAYYEFHYSTILPTSYKDITADKQRAFIRETIEPCFKSHLEAVKALKMPTGEAESIITRAVENIYNQLNLTLKGEEVEGQSGQILTKAVENYLMPHTAITKFIFDNQPLEAIENEAISEGYEIQNKAVNTYLSILPNLEGVEGLDKLSAEELGLVCAVANEFYAGNEYVTPQMLKKAWASSTGSKLKAGSKEEENYIKGINTMRKTDIKIDQREYKERKGLKENFIEDRILDIAIAEGVTINGQYQEKCWKILSMPAVIRHAINLGQITTTPAYLMDTGVNAKYLPLRDYLWNEIHRIKRDPLNTETADERKEREARERIRAEENGKPYKKREPKQKPVIRFSTLYEKLYPTADQRAKKRIQTEAQKILSFWAKHGAIKSYKLLYEGINKKKTSKKAQDSLLADAIKIDVTASETL